MVEIVLEKMFITLLFDDETLNFLFRFRKKFLFAFLAEFNKHTLRPSILTRKFSKMVFVWKLLSFYSNDEKKINRC